MGQELREKAEGVGAVFPCGSSVSLSPFYQVPPFIWAWNQPKVKAEANGGSGVRLRVRRRYPSFPFSPIGGPRKGTVSALKGPGGSGCRHPCLAAACPHGPKHSTSCLHVSEAASPGSCQLVRGKGPGPCQLLRTAVRH